MPLTFAPPSQLYHNGARNFLLLKVPPVDLSPWCQGGSDSTIANFGSQLALWNDRLTSMAYNLTLYYRDTTVFVYDTNRAFRTALADPGMFDATSDISMSSKIFRLLFSSSCFWSFYFHNILTFLISKHNWLLRCICLWHPQSRSLRLLMSITSEQIFLAQQFTRCKLFPHPLQFTSIYPDISTRWHSRFLFSFLKNKDVAYTRRNGTRNHSHARGRCVWTYLYLEGVPFNRMCDISSIFHIEIRPREHNLLPLLKNKHNDLPGDYERIK